jgi:hypothetical protein
LAENLFFVMPDEIQALWHCKLHHGFQTLSPSSFFHMPYALAQMKNKLFPE